MTVSKEVDVWLVELDAERAWLPPALLEIEHSIRLNSEPLRRRYLRAHAALREILLRYAGGPLVFATRERGKPYLADEPGLFFNLSHSHERALVAVTRCGEVGVDIERLRQLRECQAIADRFFPAVDAALLAEVPDDRREDEFFRRWTGIEAKLKASGVGLYGAGLEPEGEWSVLPFDPGPGYVAAVAVNDLAATLRLRSLDS